MNSNTVRRTTLSLYRCSARYFSNKNRYLNIFKQVNYNPTQRGLTPTFGRFVTSLNQRKAEVVPGAGEYEKETQERAAQAAKKTNQVGEGVDNKRNIDLTNEPERIRNYSQEISAEQQLGDAVQFGKEVLQKQYQGTQGSQTPGSQTISEGTQELKEGDRRKYGEWTEKGKDKTGLANSWTEDVTTEKAKIHGEEWVQKVEETTKVPKKEQEMEWVDAAKENVEETAFDTAEKAKTQGEEWGQKIGNTPREPGKEKDMEWAQTAKENVQERAYETAEKPKGWAQAAKEKAEDITEGVAEKAQDIKEGAQNVAEKTKETFQDVAEGAGNLAEKIMNKGEEIFDGAKERIKKAADKKDWN